MRAQSCLVWGWKTSVWQDAKRCEMLICPHSRPSALSIDQPEPCQIMMQVAHLLVPSATWLSICGWVDSWVRIHPHTDLVDQHADQNLTVTTSSEHETPPKKIIKVLINVFFEYSICYRTLQIQDSKLVVLTLSTTEIQPGDEACASNKRSSITVPSNNGRLLNTQGETPSWTASCPTWHTSAWRKQTDVICLDWIILNINISLTSKTFGDMQKTSIPHWGSFFHATISPCDRKLMREFLENWNIIGYETRYERIVVNISLRGCHQGSSEKWWPNPRTS